MAHAWRGLTDTFDVQAELPAPQILFATTDLGRPWPAAETVLVNMLTEIIERVDRFSPWYTRPARQFGLVSRLDAETGAGQWQLAPEAVRHWRPLLEELADCIEQSNSLIQAMLFVEGLMGETAVVQNDVLAACQCVPPGTIRLSRSVLAQAEIICTQCRQPFQPVDQSPPQHV